MTITEITWQENEIIMNKLDDDEGTSGAIAPTFTTAGVVIKRKHSQVGGSANIQCDRFSFPASSLLLFPIFPQNRRLLASSKRVGGEFDCGDITYPIRSGTRVDLPVVLI